MKIENIRTVGDLIKALQQVSPKATLVVSCWDGANSVNVESFKDYDDEDRVIITG